MVNALPHLKGSKGKIINFASGAGMEGLGNQTSYAAAKEAIRAISRVSANEWGRRLNAGKKTILALITK